MAPHPGERARCAWIWVNGQQTFGASTGAAVALAAGPMRLGSFLGANLFHGHIAHAAIYDYALSDDRIRAHYQAGAPSGIPVALCAPNFDDLETGWAWSSTAPSCPTASPGAPSPPTPRRRSPTDGAGEAIVGGTVEGDLIVPWDCTIQSATLLADTSTSSVVDIWVVDYASYPPTNSNSIAVSTPLTISSGVKAQDTTLTGWTTALTAGQTVRFNVDNNDNAKRLSIILLVS